MNNNICCFCDNDNDQVQFHTRRQAFKNTQISRSDRYPRHYSHAILRNYDWQKQQKLRQLEIRNQHQKTKLQQRIAEVNQNYKELSQRLVFLKFRYEGEQCNLKKVVTVIDEYYPKS